MDSIKSPRFWLALAGLVAVSVLAACKVFDSDVAAGLLGGLLYGLGVSTPATKAGAVTGGSTAAVALLGIGGALLGGCGVGPDAVLASLALAGALVGFLAIWSMVQQHRLYLETRRQRRAAELRRRITPDKVANIERRFSRRRAELLPAIALVALLSGGCATTGTASKSDVDVDLCRVADLALSSHQVAASTAQLICQSIADKAKRDECLKQTTKYRTLAEILLTLGTSVLNSCGLR